MASPRIQIYKWFGSILQSIFFALIEEAIGIVTVTSSTVWDQEYFSNVAPKWLSARNKEKRKQQNDPSPKEKKENMKLKRKFHLTNKKPITKRVFV